jgi:hypothetical protein
MQHASDAQNASAEVANTIVQCIQPEMRDARRESEGNDGGVSYAGSDGGDGRTGGRHGGCWARALLLQPRGNA